MGAQLKTILGKHKVLIPTIAVATALVLAFLIFVSRSNKPAEAAPRPIEVQVVKVEQKDVPVYNEWIGTTEGMVNAKFAKAQQELALVQYQQTIQTAFREVSDALVQYRKVRDIRAQQELLVTTLQDRSRLAQLRYEGGIDSLLNALDADRELFNAELSLAQTKRNELLSLVQLYKALGGGWQQ